MSTWKFNRRAAAVAAAGLAAAGGLLAVSPVATASTATTKAFKVTIKETCNVSFFGAQTLTFTYSGVAPTTVAAGGKVAVTGGVLVVGVPASLASAAASLGVTKGQGFINIEDLTSSGTPTTYNVILKAGYATNKATVTSGKPIHLTVPRPGHTFSDGTYTAGAKGSTFTLKSADFHATFNGYDASGNAVFSNQPFDCNTPAKPVTLVSIPVS